MSKPAKRQRAKPKPVRIDPLAAQLIELTKLAVAESTKLVLLGANLYHAGMKQATPTAPEISPQFSFAGSPVREAEAEKKKDRLPEV